MGPILAALGVGFLLTVLFVIYILNITEQKNAEKALHESETNFQEFVDNLPQIVFEIDSSDTFIFLNDFGLNSLAYTLNDLETGLNLFQIFIPSEKERIITNITQKT